MSFIVTNATTLRQAIAQIGEAKDLGVSAGDILYFSGGGWEPNTPVEVFKGGLSIFSLQTDGVGNFISGSYEVSSSPPTSEPTQAYVLYNGYDGFYGDSGIVNLVNTPVQVTVYFEKIGAGTTQPSGAQNFDLSDVVPVTATPSGGSTFIRWEYSSDGVNYEPVEWLPASGGTIIANDGEHWRAVFGTFATLTVNITPSGGGSVAQKIGGVNTTSPYLLGDIVMLTAYPHSGYEFTGWSGALSGSSNPAQITMNGNKTVTASFQQVFHTLAIQDPSGSGTTSPSTGSYPYLKDSIVTVTANPSEGWFLDHWLLDGWSAGSDNPAEVYMDSNHTLRVFFAEIPPDQWPVEYSVPSSVGNKVYKLRYRFQCTPIPFLSGWVASMQQGQINDQAQLNAFMAQKGMTGKATILSKMVTTHNVLFGTAVDYFDIEYLVAFTGFPEATASLSITSILLALIPYTPYIAAAIIAVAAVIVIVKIICYMEIAYGPDEYVPLEPGKCAEGYIYDAAKQLCMKTSVAFDPKLILYGIGGLIVLQIVSSTPQKGKS